jgi:tRNA (guanine-N7-)-methyltransferase
MNLAKDDIRRPRINITKELRVQTAYSLALENEYKQVAFSEERAPLNKGRWREKIFSAGTDLPIDVEIGTGAGTHFAHQSTKEKNRALVGIELKYKPLIQSIRRAKNDGATYAAMCRFHVFNIDLLFEKNEINNIYIHFPDPWTSPRKPKNRIVSENMLNVLYDLQQPGSFIEHKTDSRESFEWSLDEIAKTKYKIEFQSFDLHAEKNIYKENNFETTFEKIFIREGTPINYIRLRK